MATKPTPGAQNGSNCHDQPWQKGTEVLAVYSFKGNSSEDLPFSRKDLLTIIKPTRDPMWYWAKDKHNKEGMIPANYVQKRGEVRLAVMPWFHGKLSRDKAVDLLQPPENGLFLVRESETFPGDYTLCVSFDSGVEHYRVVNKQGELSVDDERFFENLPALIQHYEQDSDGLCTRLIKPVPKKGRLDFTVDKNAFQDQGWVIKKKDLKLGEVLGKGEFGEVCKGEYQGQPVAVKVLKDASKAAQILAEASLMTTLRHENLVQLKGVVLGEKPGDTVSIVTEFMAKGNLVDYLRSRGRYGITAKDQLRFARDACAGMAYLESTHLVHRDLAARNILLGDDETAKVADFGLALSQDALVDPGRFPIKWTAPEALKDSTKFTTKSDMWSFGILLWEIYSYGRVPYPRITVTDVQSHVERGYRMDPPDSCPPEVYDIMKNSWNIEPDKRPTFADTLKKLSKLTAAAQ